MDELNVIKNRYDAYFMGNRYDIENTHEDEFVYLRDLLKNDAKSQRALDWIHDCYDCFYKDDPDYNVQDDSNPFYYLECKIKELQKS